MKKSTKYGVICTSVIILISGVFQALLLEAEKRLAAARKLSAESEEYYSIGIPKISPMETEASRFFWEVEEWYTLWLIVLYVLPIIFAILFFVYNLLSEKKEDAVKKEKIKIKCEKIKGCLLASACVGWPIYMILTHIAWF